MLRELPLKGSTSSGERINCVVDCNLAILVVQPRVNILTTLLQDLLAKQNGGSGSINKEVILGNVDVRTHRSATIIAEMENSGLDTKPEELSNQPCC
jgi:hypothetical protein